MLAKLKSSFGKKDCNLECVVPQKPAIHEFVGPVRIVLVDTTTCTYSCRRLMAALVSAAYFLMGAVTITVLYFMMVSEQSLFVQLHVLFGTFSMMCLIPSAVLIFSPYNGSSAILKPEDKTTDHTWFHLLSLSFILATAAFVYLSFGDHLLSLSVHSIASYAAVCCFLWNMLIGIIHHYLLNRNYPLLGHLHRFFGVIAMLACTACFVTGALNLSSKLFTIEGIQYVISGFGIALIAITIYNPIFGKMYSIELKWNILNYNVPTDEANAEEICYQAISGHKENRIRIAAPLKVVVIEGRGEYWKTICCSICIGFVQLMIGATNMIILQYSLKTKDWHAFLCGFAFHFLSAEAILALNFVNAWSTSLRYKHRVAIHVIMQLLALLSAINGTMAIGMEKMTKSTSVHAVSSAVTIGLVVISAILGPFALSTRRHLKAAHISFGIPAFLASSISFISGLYMPAFTNWADPSVKYIVLGFIMFATIFIVVTAFIKCIRRL